MNLKRQEVKVLTLGRNGIKDKIHLLLMGSLVYCSLDIKVYQRQPDQTKCQRI